MPEPKGIRPEVCAICDTPVRRLATLCHPCAADYYAWAGGIEPLAQRLFEGEDCLTLFTKERAKNDQNHP